MSQIPGWKALPFCVLCNTTMCPLNPQDYQMHTKYEKGSSYTM